MCAPMRSPVCACVLLASLRRCCHRPPCGRPAAPPGRFSARAAPSMELILSDDAVFGARGAAVGVVATASAWIGTLTAQQSGPGDVAPLVAATRLAAVKELTASLEVAAAEAEGDDGASAERMLEAASAAATTTWARRLGDQAPYLTAINATATLEQCVSEATAAETKLLGLARGARRYGALPARARGGRARRAWRRRRHGALRGRHRELEESCRSRARRRARIGALAAARELEDVRAELGAAPKQRGAQSEAERALEEARGGDGRAARARDGGGSDRARAARGRAAAARDAEEEHRGQR